MTDPLRAALDAERLSDAMSDAYTYEDRDNNVPTLPFHDDFRAFWTPFAEKVLIALAADTTRPARPDEQTSALLSALANINVHSPEDLTRWVEFVQAEARLSPAAADTARPGLDVEALAWAIHAWGYEPTIVVRDDVKEPTDAQQRMARKLANAYVARLTEDRP